MPFTIGITHVVPTLISCFGGFPYRTTADKVILAAWMQTFGEIDHEVLK